MRVCVADARPQGLAAYALKSRVEPDFRAEVAAVLADGETLSRFVEASVRASVEHRRMPMW